jgi:hypothetical protein
VVAFFGFKLREANEKKSEKVSDVEGKFQVPFATPPNLFTSTVDATTKN